MLFKIKSALTNFMWGRYGTDKFYFFLFYVYLVLFFINIFARSVVISLIAFAIIVYSVFRMLSKNLPKRRAENEVFLRLWATVKKFFSSLITRIKDLPTKVYRKCPSCKSQLRLPRKRGKHTVKCPRCSNTFEVRIL